MKIIVLNGSPKGNMSVTMQYIHYAQKIFPRHELKIINIASSITKIERDRPAFDAIIREINKADGVLWAFPLYYWIVHSGYMRFIELIRERGVKKVFKDKYAAAFSTSIHFFDNTAHNYMHAVCDDLDMKYTGFYSADMHDLLDAKMRVQITAFFEDFFSAIENKVPSTKAYLPVNYSPKKYIPGAVKNKINTSDKRILIITDYTDKDTNLKGMALRLKDSFKQPARIININDISIKGGCLGCIQCGFDNKCVYGDNDDIKKVYNTEIKNSDVLIYALKITGRYFSSRFKMFLDRSFLNTHQPRNIGKQIAFVISGPLAQNPNVREIVQAYAELTGGNFNGIITDEAPNPAEIDGLLDSLALKLVSSAVRNTIKPMTFLGVGGLKIFRDDLFANLKFAFQGDYKYYKKHGLFDFPQKNFRIRLFNFFMIPFSKIPPVRESIRKDMKKHMIEPYQKIMNTI